VPLRMFAALGDSFVSSPPIRSLSAIDCGTAQLDKPFQPEVLVDRLAELVAEARDIRGMTRRLRRLVACMRRRKPRARKNQRARRPRVALAEVHPGCPRASLSASCMLRSLTSVASRARTSWSKRKGRALALALIVVEQQAAPFTRGTEAEIVDGRASSRPAGRRRRLAVFRQIVTGRGPALVPDGVLQAAIWSAKLCNDENIRKYT